MDLFNCCGKPSNTADLRMAVAPGDGGPLQRYCKDCITSNGKAAPDVYFGKEYINGALNYEENIADPKTGKPIPFYDKTSKAAAMKQAEVIECGDRKHGARNEDTLRAGKTKYFL